MRPESEPSENDFVTDQMSSSSTGLPFQSQMAFPVMDTGNDPAPAFPWRPQGSYSFKDDSEKELIESLYVRRSKPRSFPSGVRLPDSIPSDNDSVPSFLENQRQSRFCFCLLLGVSLMVFPGFSFSADTSSFYSKLGTSEKNLDPEHSYGSFHHNFKYIMKSYYEKYESLDDSDYKDFLAQLPFGLCDVEPENPNIVLKLLALERKLIGEGSHRHLSTSIRISIGIKTTAEMPQRNCVVIVIQKLPLGVFADPFELQHLQRQVFNDIAVFGDTNLESPSFLSNRSAVEIHMEVGPVISTRKNEINIKLELPLHARYAPLNETGYTHVRFAAPDLYLHCSVEGKSHSRSCLYRIENDGAELRSGEEIVWKIPSGIKTHAGIVYSFTFISAFLAALIIVLTSICHSSTSRCKSMKQS